MKNSLKVNAFLSVFRQAMTIVFPFITFPYISRILGTSEFGRYNFALSFLNYFALLAVFGIMNYGIREGSRLKENSKEINKFASELFSYNIITTFVAYLALFTILIFNKSLDNYSKLILVQSLSIVFTTIGMDWINIIFEDFLYITIRYIIIQILALFAIFLFVKSPQDTLIYCLIMTLGSYGGNLINIFYLKKYVRVKFTFKIPFRRFFTPTFILFINSLAIVIYVNSDITILGILKSSSDVGIYSFSSKLYNILKTLINSAIIVAIPRLSSILVKDKIKYIGYLKLIMNNLVLILLPVATGLATLSDSIIVIVGGREYLPGDLVLKILSFSLISALIASIYTNCVLIIGGQEKKTLIGTITSASINVAGNFILIPFIGINGAAITTVLSETLNLLIQKHYVRTTILSDRLLQKKTLRDSLIGVIIVFIVTNVVIQFLNNSQVLVHIIKVILSLLFSVILYGSYLYFVKNEQMQSMIKNRHFK